MAIKFWGPDHEYGIFSNFAESPIVIDGDYYPTVEHYFQAAKAADSAQRKYVMESPTPKVAKARGREVTLRSDWEREKCSIMMRGLQAKAQQCPEFRAALLSTGEEELIEASPFVYYWGEGRDHSGRNMLGELLVDVRQMIKDGEL